MLKRAVVMAASVAAVLFFATSAAKAQSAPTCAFDEPGAQVMVSVDGQPATLSVSSGAILLNGVQCGTATVDNTDSITVDGSTRVDTVTLTGVFAPGLTPEADGNSEIEIDVALGIGPDDLEVDLTGGTDLVSCTAQGIDLGNDGDQDLTTSEAEGLTVAGKGGNDTIDCSAYLAGGLTIYGGPGDDLLIGSSAADVIYGQAGNDVIDAEDGNDVIHGSSGDDDVFGGAGNDDLMAEHTLDGADEYYGGAGVDMLWYSGRTAPISVTIGNGLADDGEVGELDLVDVDVENVVGGSGNDTLIGSAGNNYLYGGAGDDTMNGGAGSDSLYADAGADLVDGGSGNDFLYGEAGNDELRGGTGQDILYGGGDDDLVIGGGGADFLGGDNGNDTLRGGPGADTLRGGPGRDRLWGGADNDSLDGGDDKDAYHGDAGDDDFLNADGVAELVSCGDGIDSVEAESVDTFDSCEVVN